MSQMAERNIRLTLNGAAREIYAEDDTPLIYVLRNQSGLKGTRAGCGMNQCGSCHVLLDGQSVPACDTPLWAAEGKHVVTVEGLARTKGVTAASPNGEPSRVLRGKLEAMERDARQQRRGVWAASRTGAARDPQ